MDEQLNNRPTDPFPEERRLASVMFADIQGFTSLADRLDFEEISDLIKAVWLRLDQVIVDHGGFIDKHIGDAVMAIWGVPLSREDDAERAVAAALEMQKSLADFQQTLQHAEVNSLKIRIGINSGLVMTGYVGLNNEYTVMGDTVNVASRFEQIAEAGTVVISETTHRLIRGAFSVRRIAPLNLRGKPEPIPALLVESKLDQPSTIRYRGKISLQTQMVGREAEMTRLAGFFQQVVAQQRPVMALVSGEAGLGKSRLLMEFASQLDSDHPELLMMSARCLAQTSKVPLYLWKSMWQNRFGLSDNDPPEVARQKFPPGIRQLWGQQLGLIPVVEVIHFIGDLIGLEWPDSPYLAKTANDHAARFQRAFEVNRALFQRMSATRPLILVLDDLQWADQRSLDLLAFLLQPSNEPFPMLILGGGRPEFLERFQRRINKMEVLALKPLSTSIDVITQAYPDLKDFPENVLKDLARRAEGNPYFLEELVRSLLKFDQKNLGQINSKIRVDLNTKLPVTLQSSLQARIDTLSSQARNVILLASVIGRVFWLGAVIAAASKTKFTTGLLSMPSRGLKDMIQTGLEELTLAELAFPRAGSVFAGEKEYIFKHSLLRDVAYSLLPIKYRHQCHIAVGYWLNKTAGPDYKILVADHFEHAEAIPEAIQFYQQAADHARTYGATEEIRWLEGHIRALKTK